MQTAFCDGTLDEEYTWQTVVLIPKGRGDFPGIGLIEVLWKAVARLLNCWLTEDISFHNTLHGLWAGQGTGTAALEAKLLQHLTAMREAVLFEVFLDIWKACNTLYKERALDLLELYKFGPRTFQLLWMYWDRLTMVANVGKYFRRPFKGYRGITQGHPLSPIIFKVVLDSVICHWVTVVTPAEGEQ